MLCHRKSKLTIPLLERKSPGGKYYRSLYAVVVFNRCFQPSTDYFKVPPPNKASTMGAALALQQISRHNSPISLFDFVCFGGCLMRTYRFQLIEENPRLLEQLERKAAAGNGGASSGAGSRVPPPPPRQAGGGALADPRRAVDPRRADPRRDPRRRK